MQSVRYENPLGVSVSIDPKASDYIFDSISGQSAADTDLVTTQPTGMDGVLLHDVKVKDREVTVNLHVIGKGREDLYRKRQQLIALTAASLHSGGKLGKLIYSNNYGTWWVPATIKVGARERGKRTANIIPMRIIFACPDPYWRANNATISKLAYLSGGFKFPLIIPAESEDPYGIRFGSRGYQAAVYNDGDAPAPLILTITGPALRPIIELKKTGQKIIVNRVLDAGDTLTINTERGHKRVEIETAIGDVEDVMGALDAESYLFSLEPGENLLEYSSGNDTTTSSIIATIWSRFGGV